MDNPQLNSHTFYKTMPVVTHFAEVFQPQHHHRLPSDWIVVLTDIVNSTAAIEGGRYKDVNIAGGLTAMAISNALNEMEFPFIFGGDGMTCLIPPVDVSLINDILFDTRKKVRDFFQLELRVGMLSVEQLEEKGHPVKLSKFRSSPYYDQAILHGDSITYAERLIKEPEGANFLIQEKQEESVEADFTGFSCRWEDIPNNNGEILSTIITLRDANSPEANRLLSDILLKRKQIFGQEYQPISTERLRIAQSEQYLGKEALVVAGQSSGIKYLLKLLQFKFEAFVTALAIRFNIPIKAGHYQLNQLKDYQVASSDYQKYDGSLKMVIDGSEKARIQWQAYLDKLYQEKKIYYGIHIADRAIMTCLLHEGSTREVHFIDAADGGHAMAAKQLKAQILTGD